MTPYHLIRIGVFGSVGRGENVEGSDIDILYDFQKTVGLFTLLGIIEDLEDKLKQKVDLISEKYANPKLNPGILKDLKVIYEQK